MERTRRTAWAAGLGLVVSLGLFGCNDKGYSLNPPPGSPGGVGLVKNVPQIDGDWLAGSKVTANTCGSLFDIPPDRMLLAIDQADTAIDMEVVTPCDGSTGTASGTINPSNVLTVSSSRAEIVNLRCTLEVKTTLTGISNNLGDEISGSVTVDVTPVAAPLTDCGAGFPCSYQQSFTASPCPPSGCQLGACPVPAAP